MEKRKLKVVKIGGKLIEDRDKFDRFLKDFTSLKEDRVLVHGGGAMASDLCGRLGIETKMINGRRITDSKSLDVILMTYGGLINKRLVADLQTFGCNAIGLCGADGKSILSVKREVNGIDYGFVGDISRVNSDFISLLLRQGIIPVFSPISCSVEGELLNTNADSIAAEIARAMSCSFDTELYYCFEKKGVLADKGDEDSVIEHLNREKYIEMLEKNLITDGMLPKLQNCFESLQNGISKIYLGDFRLLGENSKCTKILN